MFEDVSFNGIRLVVVVVVVSEAKTNIGEKLERNK